MSKMYFITGNSDKVREARDIIPDIEQLDIDLPEIQEVDPQVVVEAKLSEAYAHTKEECIIEDTSLYLTCLNGLPGPLIKWFLITVRNEGLIKMIEGFDDRHAEAKTIVGYCDGSGQFSYFEGVVQGSISPEVRGQGFGWDPVFIPKDSQKTFGEMSQEEKGRYSMRGKALSSLKEYLNTRRL